RSPRSASVSGHCTRTWKSTSTSQRSGRGNASAPYRNSPANPRPRMPAMPRCNESVSAITVSGSGGRSPETALVTSPPRAPRLVNPAVGYRREPGPRPEVFLEQPELVVDPSAMVAVPVGPQAEIVPYGIAQEQQCGVGPEALGVVLELVIARDGALHEHVLV